MPLRRQGVRQHVKVARVAERQVRVQAQHARGDAGQASPGGYCRRVERDHQMLAIGRQTVRCGQQTARWRRHQQAANGKLAGGCRADDRHLARRADRQPTHLDQHGCCPARGLEQAEYPQPRPAVALLVVQQPGGLRQEPALPGGPIVGLRAGRIGGRGKRARGPFAQHRGDRGQHRLLLVHAAQLPGAQRATQRDQHDRDGPADHRRGDAPSHPGPPFIAAQSRVKCRA